MERLALASRRRFGHTVLGNSFRSQYERRGAQFGKNEWKRLAMFMQLDSPSDDWWKRD